MSEEDKVPSPDGAGVVPEPETVRRRPKWLAPAAVGCVLVLLAVGGVAGYRMWSARELAEAVFRQVGVSCLVMYFFRV